MSGDGALQSGFMVVHGNRLEDLRDLTVQWLKRYPLRPLENEVILVQSNGIAQWLKLALAADEAEEGGGCGIAAAVDVQLPARFVWQAYRAVLGPEQIPAESVFDKQRLTWRLMRQLPELLTRPEFAPLSRFLADDQDMRKRHQLAERLADLFDQYQVYRADWLQEWEAGRDRLFDARGIAKPLEASQLWQPALWRAVLEDVGPDRRSDSRASVHLRFLEAAAELTERPAKLPRRIVVFGISSLPRQALEVLQALARVCQVLLCVLNPCRHYWADIVADRDLLRAQARRQALKPGMPAQLAETELHLHAQPLLAAWGKQGRDYIRLLDEFDDPSSYRDFIEELPWQRIDLFGSNGTETLLQQLQDDILELRPLAETRSQWPPVDPQRDESIRFHVAHSPLREVEILHDQLLERFSADPTLRPRDIIVMVPDIDAYAPHIRAVFGQIERDDPRFIPFTLSDQAQRGRDPLLVALERLLRLPELRFSVSDLLDLLDVPALRAAFDIAEADLPLLHRWARGAGVRWGLDGGQRESLGLPAGLEQNTWSFGLRRMLLGYAVGNGEAWQDIEPYGEVGGLEAALVGPLTALIDALESFWQMLRTPASPPEWGERLRALLRRFFRPADARDSLTLTQLDEALEQWENACADAAFSEPVPLTVVREAWLSGIDTGGLSQRFLAGAVNFCTLMPMRAIPFRMVCLLGMNDGDYPRTHTPLDFDLMANDYRPGDRSRREDDRYLFLEALLSARERLYISWVGRSIRDNSARPPSVLLGQLRDHIAAGWRLQDAESEDGGEKLLEALTLYHPLQPFSRSYFPPQQSRLYTYAAEWRAAHELPNPDREDAALPPLTLDAPLTLGGLAAFLANPVRTFFNQRLKVFFDETALTADDLEPFEVTGLDAWTLRDWLLQEALDVALDPEQVAARLQATLQRIERCGLLPMAGLAEPVKEELLAPLGELLSQYRALAQRYSQPVAELQALRYEAATVVVEDWLSGLRRSGEDEYALLYPRPSMLREKKRIRWHQLVRPWVAHLLAHACDLSLTSYVVGQDAVILLPPLAPEQARTALTALLEAWSAGLCEPLPVACKTAFAWLDALSQSEEAALAAASDTYDGGRFGGERSQCPYLSRAYPDAAALLADGRFGHWAECLYRPLLASAQLLEQAIAGDAAEVPV